MPRFRLTKQSRWENIFLLNNILTSESQDCLDDPVGCIINPIAENPTNPILLAAIGAATFGIDRQTGRYLV